MKNHNQKKDHTDPESPNFTSWRDALEALRTQNGAISELSAKLEALEAEQLQLFDDREKALADSDEELLARLLARDQILAAREKKLQAQLADSKERSANILGHAQHQFGSLQRLFYVFTFDTEKTALSAQMVPGCPLPTLDQAVSFLKPVGAVRALEIPLSLDSETFIATAARLLEAVGAQSAFTPPPCKAFVPAGKGSSAEPANAVPETLAGPFPDLPGGLSQREIDAEWTKIRKENPLATMAETTRLFSEKFPNVFLTREEVLQLQAPLGQSTVPDKWRAPMIGDTRPSENEGPPVAERDQVFATLNS